MSMNPGANTPVSYFDDLFTPTFRSYRLPARIEIPAGQSYRYQQGRPIFSFYEAPSHIKDMIDDPTLLDPVTIREVFVDSNSQHYVNVVIRYEGDWYKVHGRIVMAIQFYLQSWPSHP